MNKLFKYALMLLGARVSMSVVRRANSAVNSLELGRWLRANGYPLPSRLRCRERLYDQIASKVGKQRVLYLEFGVYQGASLRYWSNLLTNPETHLHGFDSFEGLPEAWGYTNPKGDFSTNGQMPTFNDPRIRLFKGWFQNTLPAYILPTHDVLILHMDADLYSSTIFVLETLKDAIKPGTYIMFDEFSDRFHELRAFDEFLQSSRMPFSLVGATKSLAQFAFVRV